MWCIIGMGDLVRALGGASSNAEYLYASQLDSGSLIFIKEPPLGVIREQGEW